MLRKVATIYRQNLGMDGGVEIACIFSCSVASLPARDVQFGVNLSKGLFIFGIKGNRRTL